MLVYQREERECPWRKVEHRVQLLEGAVSADRSRGYKKRITAAFQEAGLVTSFVNPLEDKEFHKIMCPAVSLYARCPGDDLHLVLRLHTCMGI